MIKLIKTSIFIAAIFKSFEELKKSVRLRLEESHILFQKKERKKIIVQNYL